MKIFNRKKVNMNLRNMDLRAFSDDDLIDLLFTEDDRLSRNVVDEFLRRGLFMIQPLWDIIKDENNWFNDEWAVAHATYIIGAIGGEDAIMPLIMSARFASAHDYDWISEALSSIFGKIGEKAIEPLKKIAQDQSNGWYLRALALESLAAITINYNKYSLEIFDFIAMFLKAPLEDRTLRGLAGAILLDFQQKKYEKSLLEFGQEEEDLQVEDRGYFIEFDKKSVEKAFSREKRDLGLYHKDWLKFYDDEEIQKRQKSWKEEHSWLNSLPFYWKIKFWLKFRQFKLKMKNKKPDEGEFEEKK